MTRTPAYTLTQAIVVLVSLLLTGMTTTASLAAHAASLNPSRSLTTYPFSLGPKVPPGAVFTGGVSDTLLVLSHATCSEMTRCGSYEQPK